MWAFFFKSGAEEPKSIKCLVNDGNKSAEATCPVAGGYFAIHKWVCTQIANDGDELLHYVPMKLNNNAVVWFNAVTQNRMKAVYMSYDDATGTFTDYVRESEEPETKRSRKTKNEHVK